MTALELYKFVTDNDLEYHYIHEPPNVLLFIPTYYLEEWNELLGSHITEDNPIECHMSGGYFCFYMRDICEYFNIYLVEIFGEDVNS